METNMNPTNRAARFLTGLAVAFMQLVMTQVVTLIASFFFPGMEEFPESNPVLFVFILGITFSIGVFLVGWLALRFHWLKSQPGNCSRLAGTIGGAYLPMIVTLLWFPPLETGHPVFLISALAAVVGFHLPGWFS
jgi:hypothetical protein